MTSNQAPRHRTTSTIPIRCAEQRSSRDQASKQYHDTSRFIRKAHLTTPSPAPARVTLFSVTCTMIICGGGARSKKVSIKPGGALRHLSPLLRRAHCFWRHLIQIIQSIVEMHVKQRIILFWLSQSSTKMCSNFEMMPKKLTAHRRPMVLSHQGPSHLSTPFIGAHRSRGGFSPRCQPFIPCL